MSTSANKKKRRCGKNSCVWNKLNHLQVVQVPARGHVIVRFERLTMKAPGFAGGSLRTPGMGTVLEVRALSRAGHSEGREAQGRKGDRPSEGSVERSRGLMNKNRIRGIGDRGERA